MVSNQEIKKTTDEIKDILNKLQNDLFSKVGNNGSIWTGDAAVIAASTFDTLNTKFKIYEEKLNSFIEKEGE